MNLEIYKIFWNSIGYSSAQTPNKSNIKEEIVENKSTDVNVFNYMLEISGKNVKRKLAKKYSCQNPNPQPKSRLRFLKRIFKGSRTSRSEARDRLLTIHEDASDQA